MNKPNFLILFSFLFFICCGQSKKANKNLESDYDVGIGLLTADTNHSIPLYQNTIDEIPIDSISIKVDETGVTEFITDLELKPYALFGGDSYVEGERHVSMGLIRFPPELKFIVIDSIKNTLKIITNEDTGEFYYVKKDSVGNFETWKDYLKRVDIITKQDLKVYDKPNGELIFENKTNEHLPFDIVELKGDWAKIEKLGGYFKESDFKKYNGWTQWKSGKEILIDIIEYAYE